MVYENPFVQSVSGLELKDWVWYHTHHKTTYYKIASTMRSAFNLPDDKFYLAVMKNGIPEIIEVPERGIKEV